jgi:hypothetical protein
VKVAVAAGKELYNIDPAVNLELGCGDCHRFFMGGMPAISIRGNVVDHGGGNVEVKGFGQQQGGELASGGFYTSTASEEIDRLWSGIKQGVVFAAAYSGLAPGAAESDGEPEQPKK